jgi:MoxR-like ATPase
MADANAAAFRRVEAEIGKVLVGQRELVRRLLIALLCDGHVLLEGLPGLAKTTVVKALASCLQASFSRVQFTPDLLPADIVGTRIFEGGDFRTRKGPIFAHILLADEINRAPAKVQSALLEAMQERQVTIGEQSLPLPRPFLVMATQNPLEQEGTYPLPEAQTDRFLMKVRVDYPSATDERQILDRALGREQPTIGAVLDTAGLLAAQAAVHEVLIKDELKDYCVALVRATREGRGGAAAKGLIAVGASPRAVIALAQAARAHAWLEGNSFVMPQDIKTVAPDVLRHRILPSYEAEAEGLDADQLVERILDDVAAP